MHDPLSCAVWAPNAARVSAVVHPANGPEREVPLTRTEAGWWDDPNVRLSPGDRYGYRIDGAQQVLPDPRSRFQPDGVHGLSEAVTITPAHERANWLGLDVRGHAMYEMHVGTFAGDPDSGQGGDFDTAITHLDDLVELGIDAVEVMPVASFPGDRGWGYDGVGLFATHEAYGGPEAFARFVDAAHERGLAVFLDVVYNHVGPSGNYLGQFGPYFTTDHETPWGPSINVDGDSSREVRNFIVDNARYWLVDIGVDGLRLDAVHAIVDTSDQHILAELSASAAEWRREVGRPLTLIAESDLNQPATVTSPARGGLGMHAQWADDVHHHLHAWISGEKDGYYCDFGDAAKLARSLTHIFEHVGGFSTFRGVDWGAPIDVNDPDYGAASFVVSIQNHDQVGNRAQGDRLHHAISPEQHAAVAGLYLLGAATPMIFQGEEWAASSPFAFFSDHDAELGPLVSKGRAEEFARMGWSGEVPDPQARSTFASSILRWQERADAGHASMLAIYRELLRLRREHREFRAGSFHSVSARALSEDAVLMRRGRFLVLASRGAGREAHAGEHAIPFVEGARLVFAVGKVDQAQAFTLRGAGLVVIQEPAPPSE